MNAVSRITVDGDELSFLYEDNGNLTNGWDISTPGQFAERNILYDAENRPLSIEYLPEGGTAVLTQYTYDGDGRRTKKEGGSDTVIYVDETYEIRNGQAVKYIFAGNMRLSKVVGSNVQYFHKDHLRSSTLVTDATGVLVESKMYEVYGQPQQTCQASSGEVAYTFTDQEWDAESGLYNYDARLYDPVIGRFLTADSVVPNWYDPQALNRYAYARNNPAKYVDPDGHVFVIGTIAAVAAAAWIYDAIVSPTAANTPMSSSDPTYSRPGAVEVVGNMATGALIAHAAVTGGVRAFAGEVADEVGSVATGGVSDVAKIVKNAPKVIKKVADASKKGVFPKSPKQMTNELNVDPKAIKSGQRWRPSDKVKIEHHEPGIHPGEPNKPGHYHVSTKQKPPGGKTRWVRSRKPDGSADYHPGDKYPGN